MAWNQPGGSSNNPWGKRPAGGGSNVDDAFKNFQKRLEALLRGGGPSSGGPGGAEPSSGGGAADRATIWAVVGIAVAFWLYQCVFTVGAAENGVVQRFGKFVSIREPGLRWHFWPIERVTKVNSKEVNSLKYESKVLTQDINLIDMALTVQYQLRDPVRFLFQVRDPKETLRQVSESAIREVVGRSTLDSIFVSNRTQVTERTRDLIQRTLDQYNIGIAVTSVNLTEIQVPEAVVPSQRDANKALADKEALTKQAEAYASGIIPRAEGLAQRRILEAEAYRSQVLALAQGEASRFDQLVVAYNKSPRVTRERLYIDAVENVLSKSRKVIVDTGSDGGSKLFYLPLDKLVERSTTSRDADAAAASASAARPAVGDSGEPTVPDSRPRGER